MKKETGGQKGGSNGAAKADEVAVAAAGSVEQFEAAATTILREVGQHHTTVAMLEVMAQDLPRSLDLRRQSHDVLAGMFTKMKAIREGGPDAVPRDGQAKKPAGEKPAARPAQKAGGNRPAAAAEEDGGKEKAAPAARSGQKGGGQGTKKKKIPVTVTGNTATAKDIDGGTVSITLDPADKAKYEDLTRRDLIVALANDYGEDGEFSITQAKCFFTLMGKGKPQSQLTMMLGKEEVEKLGRGKWKLAEGVEMTGGEDAAAEEEDD